MFVLAILLVYFLHSGKCQKDTVEYFYGFNNKVTTLENAIRTVEIVKRDSVTYIVRSFNKSNNKWNSSPLITANLLNDSVLQLATNYGKNNQEITRRIFTVINSCYHFRDVTETGRIIQSGISKSLLPLHLEGELKLYFPSGHVSRIEEYFDNQMIGNKNWLESGEAYIDNYYFKAEVMPEYYGGLEELAKFLAEAVRYPVKAQKRGVQGRVFVQFIVDEEGLVNGACVVRGVQKDLNDEALRVVNSMGKWKPGIIGGKFVKVSYVLPINFVLN